MEQLVANMFLCALFWLAGRDAIKNGNHLLAAGLHIGAGLALWPVMKIAVYGWVGSP